jgi:hypothetical protein
MALLTDFLSVRFVARHAGFDVVHCLNSVRTTVHVVHKTWNVRSRKNKVVAVAVGTELSVGVTGLAILLECLGIERMRECVVERMCEPVEVVTLVTILAVVHIVTRLARLIAVYGSIGTSDVGVNPNEVGLVTQRH